MEDVPTFKLIAEAIDGTDCVWLGKALAYADDAIAYHTKLKSNYDTHYGTGTDVSLAKKLADVNIAVFQNVKQDIEARMLALSC